jgi:hypothetical protein
VRFAAAHFPVARSADLFLLLFVADHLFRPLTLDTYVERCSGCGERERQGLGTDVCCLYTSSAFGYLSAGFAYASCGRGRRGSA